MNALIEKLPLIIAWFTAFSMRIVVLPEVWSFYVPVVSPVYGSAAHWLRSSWRTHAILAHVLSGVLTVLCGIVQLDKPLRRARPGLHRWSGRLYMVAGAIMVLTLRPLRETSGGFARPGDGASPAMALFIDATTVAWFASAVLAVFYAAVRRDFISHRRWAATNFAVVLTPLAQRISLMLIVPAAIAGRLMRDALVHGLPFWSSAWGVAPQTWSGPPSAPKVLSFEGYGVAENMVFPYPGTAAASAWLGFSLVAAAASLAAWAKDSPPTAAAVDADVIGADEGGGGRARGASGCRTTGGAGANNRPCGAGRPPRCLGACSGGPARCSCRRATRASWRTPPPPLLPYGRRICVEGRHSGHPGAALAFSAAGAPRARRQPRGHARGRSCLLAKPVSPLIAWNALVHLTEPRCACAADKEPDSSGPSQPGEPRRTGPRPRRSGLERPPGEEVQAVHYARSAK
ncbi:unnamed protein product, partial [Prorocentrum cordatum]